MTGEDYVYEEVAARLSRLELRLDELDNDYEVPARQARKEPVYEDLDSWVANFFAATFTRSLGGEWRWCPRWREHTEAVFRLDALWRSFETLRREVGMGYAVWLRDHLDQQHSLLLGSRGPFALCSTTRHEALAKLPISD